MPEYCLQGRPQKILINEENEVHIAALLRQKFIGAVQDFKIKIGRAQLPASGAFALIVPVVGKPDMDILQFRMREAVLCDKPYHAVDSPRRTQGVLLWKINDTWPQFYCTLIDYYLEAHLPYYQVRRSYAPVLLSFDFQDAAYLWGVNDTDRIVEGSLYLCSFSPARNCVDKEITVPVRIRPGESKVLTDLDELCPIVREEVIYASLTDSDGRQISRADTVLDIERNLSFQEPELTLWAEDGMLCVRANRFAYCVELSGEENGDLFGWHFEDNYFNLLPFETKKIKIYTKHTSGTICAKAYYASNQTRMSCENLTLNPL